jgi:hypothetical protein
MKLRRFESFKDYNESFEMLLESMVYLSPKFRKKIGMIDSPISKKLLSLQGKEIKDDISFLDFDETPGMFTFKTMKNYKKNREEGLETAKKWGAEKLMLLNGTYLISDIEKVGDEFEGTEKIVDDLFDGEHSTVSTGRNPFKIGRFINAVFPGEFTSGEIENFTNSYKAVQKAGDAEIVEGEEIRKWYLEDNYLNMTQPLGTSCMRYAKCQSYFDIYVKNSDVCKMACIFELDDKGEKKLAGRAIVWKVSKVKFWNESGPDFEWFMDRQYGVSDDVITKLRNYAVKKGWAYKTKNSTNEYYDITIGSSNYKCNLEVQLGDFQFSRFPYMDTFKRYDPDNNILYNDIESSKEGYYLLSNTGGGYELTGEEDEDEDDRTVWSDFYGENIDADYAVWSDYYDSYLHIDQAVEVQLGPRSRRDWYPDTSDEINLDGWTEEYFHVDDLVYSDTYEYSIYVGDSVRVITKIDSEGKVEKTDYFHEDDTSSFIKYEELKHLDWFKYLSGKYSEWSIYTAISKEILFRDELDNWVLTDFSETVYHMKGVDDLILSEVDMEILGLEDWSRYTEIDKVSYYKFLKDSGYLDKLIQTIEDKLSGKFYDDVFDGVKSDTKGLEDRLEELKEIKEGNFR